MVLHAIVHLFHGGEMDDALRDLVDIDELLRHFGATEAGFWSTFWGRAEALDLARPAYYGAALREAILGTRIPANVAAQARAGAPFPGVLSLMDQLVPRALFPQHPDHPGGSPGRNGCCCTFTLTGSRCRRRCSRGTSPTRPGPEVGPPPEILEAKRKARMKRAFQIDVIGRGSAAAATRHQAETREREAEQGEGARLRRLVGR